MAQIPATRGNPQASEIAVQTALPMVGALSREDLQTTLDLANNEIAKLFEDRNIELVDGGIITVNSTATTVAFSSSLKLHVNSLVAGGSPIIIDLASTTRTVSADGRMIYAVIDRSAGTAVITDDSATLPAVTSANQEVFLIAKRVGTTIYFRNGFAISANNSSDLKGQSSEYLQASISTDSSSTGANATITAVSGGIVRLTNASLTSLSGIPATAFPKLLVLENKTGATVSINNEEATATAANRILTGTAANVSLSTNASLFLVYDTTSARWQVVGGTGNGTGSGVVNLIVNGDAESATTSIFTPYADGAAYPIDGTGGSPTVTTSVTSSAPLAGDKSYLLSIPASAAVGNGFSIDIPLDLAYRGKSLKISFDYIFNTVHSLWTENSMIWTCYDITNSKIVEPSNIKMFSKSTTTSDKFQATVQFDTNCTSFRLIGNMATTFGSPNEIKVDNVTVSPQNYVYGTPFSDWQQYTPTFTGLGTPTGIDIRWRRAAQSVEIEGRFTSGTVTGAAATISLPAGLVGLPTSAYICGDYGTQGTTTGSAVVYDPTNNNLYFGMANWGVTATGTQVATGGFNSFNASIPIRGWSSSVQMSDSADTRVISFSAYPNATALAANGTIPFSVVEKDTHGAVSSNQYRVPVAGDYIFSATLISSAVTAFRIKKNGSLGKYVGQVSLAGGIGGGSITLTNLVAGDLIEVVTENAATITGSVSFAISISRISGPSAIAANEKIRASYGHSSGQTIANSTQTTFLPTVRKYDTHGVFNAATGEIKLPRAGFGQIKANFLFTALTTAAAYVIRLGVYKNGVFYKSLDCRFYNSSSGEVGATGSCDIEGISGDLFTVSILHTQGTTRAIYSGGSATEFNFLDFSME